MNHGPDTSAYGLWSLVIINSAIFLIFAFSFFKPRSKRDWRTFGGFSAFIVALFVEMYGFPLTIYLLSGWIARRYPAIDPLGHDAGHLWDTLLGFKGSPHSNPIHIASMFGFLLQWPTLVTLAMFPILVVLYVRLAHREEREVANELGDAWRDYATRTLPWFPRFGVPASGEPRGGGKGVRV